MENSKSKKNEIFYLILLVFTLIIMVIGITFTYFALFAKENDDSTMLKTGTLDINYIDGKEINTYALLPISEPNLDTKYSTYKKSFSISSNGTLDQVIDIYINVTDNEFSDNALGFILYDGTGNWISKGTIPSSGKVILGSNVDLKSNESKSFTVLIWLRDNYENQDYEQGKSFTGGFDIVAEQIKYE